MGFHVLGQCETGRLTGNLSPFHCFFPAVLEETSLGPMISLPSEAGFVVKCTTEQGLAEEALMIGLEGTEGISLGHFSHFQPHSL